MPFASTQLALRAPSHSTPHPSWKANPMAPSCPMPRGIGSAPCCPAPDRPSPRNCQHHAPCPAHRPGRGASSATTSGRGAGRASGRAPTISCGVGCGRPGAAGPIPVPPSSTASRPGRRKKGGRGYDAGKKVKGCPRHVAVAVQGLLPALDVHPAARDRACCPQVRIVWADAGHAGPRLEAWVREHRPWDRAIVRRPRSGSGFRVLPRHRVVARTFGWLGRHRRPTRTMRAARTPPKPGSASPWPGTCRSDPPWPDGTFRTLSQELMQVARHPSGQMHNAKWPCAAGMSRGAQGWHSGTAAPRGRFGILEPGADLAYTAGMNAKHHWYCNPTLRRLPSGTAAAAVGLSAGG